MEAYEAYLFDWDGTLARTLEIWLDTVYEQFHAHGIKITREDNARHFGNRRSPLLYGLPEEKLEAFIQKTDAAAWARLPGVMLYDDVAHMLRHLKKRGKKLALITTAWQKSLDITIGSHSIRELFDVIIVAEHVKAPKPDPESVRLALQKLGVAKEKALMLGDNERDLAAAKNAGVDSVLFYPDSHELIYKLDHLQLHNPKYTIRSWKELVDQLQ